MIICDIADDFEVWKIVINEKHCGIKTKKPLQKGATLKTQMMKKNLLDHGKGLQKRKTAITYELQVRFFKNFT